MEVRSYEMQCQTLFDSPDMTAVSAHVLCCASHFFLVFQANVIDRLDFFSGWPCLDIDQCFVQYNKVRTTVLYEMLF